MFAIQQHAPAGYFMGLLQVEVANLPQASSHTGLHISICSEVMFCPAQW
jgi:hypothetical protein